MYILGDIGNTVTKVFLVSINNKITKKLTFASKDINQTKLTIMSQRRPSDYQT